MAGYVIVDQIDALYGGSLVFYRRFLLNSIIAKRAKLESLILSRLFNTLKLCQSEVCSDVFDMVRKCLNNRSVRSKDGKR